MKVQTRIGELDCPDTVNQPTKRLAEAIMDLAKPLEVYAVLEKGLMEAYRAGVEDGQLSVYEEMGKLETGKNVARNSKKLRNPRKLGSSAEVGPGVHPTNAEGPVDQADGTAGPPPGPSGTCGCGSKYCKSVAQGSGSGPAQ